MDAAAPQLQRQSLSHLERVEEGERDGLRSRSDHPADCLDYGQVSFTRRSRFLTTFLYELPFGRRGMLWKNANKLMDQIVGGWQLAGVMLFQSGPFLTVVAPSADPAGNNFPKKFSK